MVYNLVLFSLFHLNLFRCPVTIIYRWVFQLYYVHSKRKSFRTNDHWQNFSNEECKCMLKFRHGHNECGYMSVEFFWNNICVFSLNSYHHADSVSWELLIKKNIATLCCRHANFFIQVLQSKRQEDASKD